MIFDFEWGLFYVACIIESQTSTLKVCFNNLPTLSPIKAHTPRILLLTGIHMACESADAQVFVTSYKYKNSTHTCTQRHTLAGRTS